MKRVLRTLIQLYVQKLTGTTFPFKPAIVSGWPLLLMFFIISPDFSNSGAILD